MKRYISLGAGVQSSTMALMSTVGELPESVDGAIFADTPAEPPSVYRWLEWLEGQLSFPVYRVTKGDLRADGLLVRKSKKGRWYARVSIPVFTKNKDGSDGQMWRKCTTDYKVLPIIRKLRELHPKKDSVESWIGITTDEAHRMKDSRDAWIVHRWPLIEIGMSRADCLKWMESHGHPRPPRSACVFCPYHSDREWIELQKKEPEAFKDATEFENQLRTVALERGDTNLGRVYLHPSRIPLERVEFRHERQLDLWGNECEGMCGI